MSDVVVRELPDGYPVRVFMGKEDGWVTEQQEFRSETRDLWRDEVGPIWSQFWPVALRWVVLFDKFCNNGDEKVSAELRQLEKDLRMLELQANTGSKDSGEEPTDSGVADEVAAMRARISSASAG